MPCPQADTLMNLESATFFILFNLIISIPATSKQKTKQKQKQTNKPKNRPRTQEKMVPRFR